MSSCEWCGAEDAAGTCPRAVSCPLTSCGAGPGQACKRPSGHRAARLHAGRIARAEAMHVDHGPELDHVDQDEPTDDQLANRYGVEGGIAYPTPYNGLQDHPGDYGDPLV